MVGIMSTAFVAAIVLTIVVVKSFPCTKKAFEPPPHKNETTDTTATAPEPIASAPMATDPYAGGSYNMVVSEATVAGGAATMANTYCGFTYRLPAGWASGGIVGGTDLSSPADLRQAAAYDKAHPVIEGDGPVFATLFLSCENTVSEYLREMSAMGGGYANAAGKATLADAFAVKAFHGKGEATMVNLREIGDKAAFEILRQDTDVTGRTNRNFSLVIERPRVLVIQMIGSDYAGLSPEARSILDSLKFTPAAVAKTNGAAGERIINFRASELPRVSFRPCMYCDDTSRDYTEAERTWLTRNLVASYATSQAANGLVVMWAEFSVARRDGSGSLEAVLFNEESGEFMTDNVDIIPTKDGKFEMVAGAGPGYRG
jgi:hypothetical protein